MKAFKKSKIMIGLLMLVVLAITAACTPAAAPPQAGQMGESAMSETTDYMPWSPVWRVRPALSADGPMAESQVLRWGTYYGQRYPFPSRHRPVMRCLACSIWPMRPFSG